LFIWEPCNLKPDSVPASKNDSNTTWVACLGIADLLAAVVAPLRAEASTAKAPGSGTAGRARRTLAVVLSLHWIGNARYIHHAIPGTHGESWIFIDSAGFGGAKNCENVRFLIGNHAIGSRSRSWHQKLIQIRPGLRVWGSPTCLQLSLRH
jgi:hypothetical protein